MVEDGDAGHHGAGGCFAARIEMLSPRGYSVWGVWIRAGEWLVGSVASASAKTLCVGRLPGLVLEEKGQKNRPLPVGLVMPVGCGDIIRPRRGSRVEQPDASKASVAHHPAPTPSFIYDPFHLYKPHFHPLPAINFITCTTHPFAPIVQISNPPWFLGKPFPLWLRRP